MKRPLNGFRLDGQGDAHSPRLASFGREDFQFAVVDLDDLAADGQSKAQAHIARGEERRRSFLSGLGGEPGSVVLHVNLQSSRVIAGSLGMKPHADFRVRRVGLKGVENDLRERVFERCPVSGQDNRLEFVFAFELRRLGRLVLASFFVGSMTFKKSESTVFLESFSASIC